MSAATWVGRAARVPRTWLGLVKFSHSIFALPFALQGAWIAARGVPPVRTLGWILWCCVAARTAAMAFNRLVDRRLDAENPRTAGRELPRGLVAPASVAALVALASAAFVGGAYALSPLCGRLSFPVLAVVLGYSFAKRFTWAAHAWLGLSLALAPLGAWLAVTGDLEPPLLLAAIVLCWVAGFDLIYACQDEGFDRRAGLHSIPARFGRAAALRASRSLHSLTVVLLVSFGASADLSSIYFGSVILAALLLWWEHSLVSPEDLSRVDAAFFTANGWMGVGLFAGLAADLALAG